MYLNIICADTRLKGCCVLFHFSVMLEQKNVEVFIFLHNGTSRVYRFDSSRDFLFTEGVGFDIIYFSTSFGFFIWKSAFPNVKVRPRCVHEVMLSKMGWGHTYTSEHV